MTIRLRDWQNTAPPVNKIVWVWYSVTAILATWDGANWRTTEGELLRDVAWWHKQ